MQKLRVALVSLAFALAALGPVAVSHARVTSESGYTKAQNYSAALRFLRVDKNYEVTERDPDAAYLIFRYPTPERKEGTATGTIEVVELEHGVTLIVKLAAMPQYHERLLADELQRKLQSEYGPPPPPPKNKVKKEAPEEGKGDSDEGKGDSGGGKRDSESGRGSKKK